MIGERIKRARKAAGLSLRALAEQVGVSQTAINKYEKESLMPSSAQLLKLSKALDVRTEYFYRPIKVELKGIEYRKRSSAPQRVINRIEADVLDQAERWTSLLSLYPRPPVPSYQRPTGLPQKIACLSEVDAIADSVRVAWELGINPIPDLIDVLESHGILVIVSNVDVGQKLDGLAASVNQIPIIVISAHWPGDRQRFTLAHELGHLLLHGHLAESIDEEAACDRFAGALLLPTKSLVKQLGEHRSYIEPQELHLLKIEFGLSMMGCFIRAFQSNIINEATKGLFVSNVLRSRLAY